MFQSLGTTQDLSLLFPIFFPLLTRQVHFLSKTRPRFGGPILRVAISLVARQLLGVAGGGF